MSYEIELENKNFVGNVVVRFLGEYFTLRAPDSGLTIRDKYQNILSSLIINPTTIDPRRVSTTIASHSVKLNDVNGAVSKLVRDTGEDLIAQQVDIWIGRTGVAMPFSDYLQLPTTRIKKITFQDNAYTFSSVQETDRMNKPIYSTKARLLGDILSATTTIIAKDSIADFPSSGYLHIENEFLGYTSKNDGTKTFSGITRGEYNTTAVAHDDNVDIFIAESITENPISLLLQLLISGGGGGGYDTLASGLGISQSLIDITDIESIRDNLFADEEFRLGLYNIENALKFIEDEILAPKHIRFKYSPSSKLTIAVLNKPKFVELTDILDDDNVVKKPKSDTDDNKIVNSLEINWDYNEDTGEFDSRTISKDEDSITLYGEKTPLKYDFKSVHSDIGGADIIDEFATELLDRLSYPSPEISLNTHVDRSLLDIGDKTILYSDALANSSGKLNFAEELEIISRAINWVTGDVSFKLAFTSFTGIRSCYICPSDTFSVITSQSIVELGAGRGDYWQVGWKVRLWSNVSDEYTVDAFNEISAIVGDQITFSNAWATTITTNHRIKFADYDDVVDEQKRYCFISTNGLDFSRSEKSYKILP